MRRALDREERHSVFIGIHDVFDIDRMDRVKVNEVKVDDKVYYQTRREFELDYKGECLHAVFVGLFGNSRYLQRGLRNENGEAYS